MADENEETSITDEQIEEFDTLTFDGNISDHVQLLLNLPEQVFKDFCRLSLDYLHNGHNEKRYNTAAEKLNTSVLEIKNAVLGIVYLLINACKYHLNDSDFSNTLSELGFSEENKLVLAKFLNAKRDNIKKTMLKFNIDLPIFHNLDWRLEVQVASRSLPEQIIPTVCLDFSYVNYTDPKLDNKNIENDDSIDGDGSRNEVEEPVKIISHRVMQCDIPNLDNMISNLEMALRETKNYHAKKIKSTITKE